MKAKPLKICQVVWLSLIWVYVDQIMPAGGGTASVLTTFVVAYTVVTIGLLLDIRFAWIISALPPIIVAFCSGVWFILNVGSFITGHELYHDSPVTIFVVLIGAAFTLLPSIILLVLFWRERKFWFIRSDKRGE
jgi:hypothetical protein